MHEQGRGAAPGAADQEIEEKREGMPGGEWFIDLTEFLKRYQTILMDTKFW